MNISKCRKNLLLNIVEPVFDLGCYDNDVDKLFLVVTLKLYVFSSSLLLLLMVKMYHRAK